MKHFNLRRTEAIMLRLAVSSTLVLGLLVPVAIAQGAAYCNVTSVVTRRLSNAVQITIRADGAMRVAWNYGDFFDMTALQQGRLDEASKRVTSLPFRITNARSKVLPLTDVGIYPASHVEVSAPPSAPEGIGLNLKVVLFTPVTVTRVNLGNGLDLPIENIQGPTVAVQLTQDQSSLIFLISSDRRTAPPLELRKAPPGGPVELAVTSTGTNVSIDALNADLSDVLREVAAKSHRQILVDGSVDHVVSLHLEDVPVDDAISSLAMAYGLTDDTSGQAIRVAEASGRSIPGFGRSVSASAPCLNTTATSVRDSLPEFLLRYIRVDAEQNALRVTGPAYLAERVQADVKLLDQPVPLVEIEATVVEFATSKDLDAALGLRVRAEGDLLTASGARGDISFRSVGPLPEAFEERLHALEANRRGRVVARPHATALLGQTARLFVGQQKYVTVLTYDMFEGAWVTDILGVDVGSKIEVKPLMLGEDGITLEMAPSVSNIAEVESRTGLPTVFTRSLNATVRVKNGDTVVVGGLAMDQASRSSRRIRGLGDLPILGSLFRAPSRSRSHSELAFFVTARVVGSSTPRSAAVPDTQWRQRQ